MMSIIYQEYIEKEHLLLMKAMFSFFYFCGLIADKIASVVFDIKEDFVLISNMYIDLYKMVPKSKKTVFKLK
jgi:hypothetical protein